MKIIQAFREHWKAGLAAFFAMFMTDLLATVMVVQEAHYNAALAGTFDVLGYIASLVCTVLAVGEITKEGWKSPKALVIVACVSVANFLGTAVGVELSKVIH